MRADIPDEYFANSKGKSMASEDNCSNFSHAFIFNIPNVTCDLRGNQTSGTKIMRLSA